MASIISLDIGTSAIKSAVLKDGIIQSLIDGVMPSVYFCEPGGEPLYCNDAVNMVQAKPAYSYWEIKRKLDKSTFFLGEQQHETSIVLKGMAKAGLQEAARTLRTPLSQVVVTVPAAFVEQPWQQLRDAVDGLEINGQTVQVVGTIAEPAAAALAYLYEKDRNRDKRRVLVIDIGAGTTDVACMEVHPKGFLHPVEYNMIGTANGASYGGMDLDNKLISLLEHKIGRQFSDAEKAEMKVPVNLLKHTLSTDDNGFFSYTFSNGKNVSLAVSRSEFEEEIQTVVTDMMMPLCSALEQSEVQKADLVIMTGGSAQVPFIQEKVKELCGDKVKELCDDKFVIYDPLNAVANGAAIYGAFLAAAVPLIRPTVHLNATQAYGIGIENYQIRVLTTGGEHLPHTSARVTLYAAMPEDNNAITRVLLYSLWPDERGRHAVGETLPASAGTIVRQYEFPVPEVAIQLTVDEQNRAILRGFVAGGHEVEGQTAWHDA